MLPVDTLSPTTTDFSFTRGKPEGWRWQGIKEGRLGDQPHLAFCTFLPEKLASHPPC